MYRWVKAEQAESACLGAGTRSGASLAWIADVRRNMQVLIAGIGRVARGFPRLGWHTGTCTNGRGRPRSTKSRTTPSQRRVGQCHTALASAVRRREIGNRIVVIGRGHQRQGVPLEWILRNSEFQVNEAPETDQELAPP